MVWENKAVFAVRWTFSCISRVFIFPSSLSCGTSSLNICLRFLPDEYLRDQHDGVLIISHRGYRRGKVEPH